MYDKTAQLEKVKVRLAISVEKYDNIINDLLDDALETINRVRKFKNTTTMPVEPKYYNLQVSMVVAAYNKIGAEGEINHTEGNFKRNYQTDGIYPLALLRQIIPLA